MDKLFGIDISKKAESDFELEDEKQTSVGRNYREPMSEVEAEDEIEEVQTEEVVSEPVRTPIRRSPAHSDTVPDLSVDYSKESQKHHDSKEIF